MLTQKKVLELLKKDFPYLRSRYNVKRIGLFGSFAKELQHKKNDIDLFIEFQKPTAISLTEWLYIFMNFYSTRRKLPEVAVR